MHSRKGPLVEGKYVSTGKNEKSGEKKSDGKADDSSLSEQKQEQHFVRSPKPPSPPARRTTKPEIRCYKCGKPGHMSFNCGRGRGKPSQGYLLCMTPLKSEQSDFPPCNVRGKINGKTAEMVIDSGCTRTLVHKRYVSNTAFTGDKITVLTAAGERLTESDGYFFTNDLLMHRKYLPEERNGIKYVDRIVVPESYRNEILRVGHTIPLSGHMGSKKTLERIAAHFFWPGLSFDVRKYCATCPQCQVVARKLKSKRAPLRPVDIVTEPFKKIAIDIVGELPRTTTGYRYI